MCLLLQKKNGGLNKVHLLIVFVLKFLHRNQPVNATVYQLSAHKKPVGLCRCAGCSCVSDCTLASVESLLQCTMWMHVHWPPRVNSVHHHSKTNRQRKPQKKRTFKLYKIENEKHSTTSSATLPAQHKGLL